MLPMDLHMHSRYSDDGDFSPDFLVRACEKAGIRTMALTDHNTVAGVGEAMEAAARSGVRCIPGIEIDCHYEGINLHMLGYGIDYEQVDFKRIEENIRRQCAETASLQLRLINEQGFALRAADVARVTADGYWPEHWTGEAFAEVLLHMPDYADHALLKPYRPGGDRSDNPYVNFYWDYCAQGKPCFVAMAYPDCGAVIQTIHNNHGIAVLAHPGVNLKGKFDLIDQIVPLGLDGLEAFSSYHSPETARLLYDKAAANGIGVTAGSDFHGKTKPAIRLGQYPDIPEGLFQKQKGVCFYATQQ